ncbi:hypoxia-inducible factor 1-alpha [Cylas formicarius]|uniref:hypoxia-inducible factor 1-alpha n=1 Tax=Cylas formicarius TaxID=197179 RepID=UPI00295871BA|nr:hypoxia-inducible factor 1-alpha [Cylas formicarius]
MMDTKPKAPKEKRRNNEKRKEKSRDAARSRRSRETEIFNDLGNALPLCSEQISQLDKASVMRLAISFLRVRDMIKLVPVLPVKDKITKYVKDESVFLKSLEGFLLVLSADGDFIYLSDNVSDYLGITQIDLMGQNVFEYSHPCDHDEIREILTSKTTQDTDAPKSVFIRLKCTLTTKGRSVNLKSATYKVIHCTGHMIKDKAECKDDDDKKGNIQSCFMAVGQPIPHPSNIDTPLPRQTFLTKHSLDMKFTHADDEFMMNILGYTSEDLIGKSVYEYHHAMDSDSVGSAYKCLFSKGQCETNRYRFLAKTGGYVWVVTQATLIYDKAQKPQSVVCVNYVISGVERKDEVYAVHQLLSLKSVPKSDVVPEIRVDLVEEDGVKVNEEESPVRPPPHRPKSRPVVSVTAKLFGVCEGRDIDDEVGRKTPEPASIRPHNTTKSIFAARTEDMSKGYLTFSDDEPGLTMLKDEPEDLTHLAPVAGDVCPIDDHPFFGDMLDDILLKDSNFVPLLNDEPSDPFISYRDYRDSSPQLLSPNLSKSPECSLPSLCSPNGSLSDEDQMSTFINLQMDDDQDLMGKSPYIPLGDDLPLLFSSDIMWNDNEKNGGEIPESNSNLAQLLSSSVNKHSLRANDHGGGIIDKTNNLEIFNNNIKSTNRNWSTKTSPVKMEVDSVRLDGNKVVERSASIKRSHVNNYDHQSKRSKNEQPKEKMSSELLHQLMSNNHHRGRPKGKSNWLLDTGNQKAACVSQPSDSVLMNLLNEEDSSGDDFFKNNNRKKKLPVLETMDAFLSKRTLLPPSEELLFEELDEATKKRIQQQQLEKQKMQENRRKWMRKSSLSLLDPEAVSISSFLELTQRDCEVNAPVNSSLLQGEELLVALDIHTQNNI